MCVSRPGVLAGSGGTPGKTLLRSGMPSRPPKQTLPGGSWGSPQNCSTPGPCGRAGVAPGCARGVPHRRVSLRQPKPAPKLGGVNPALMILLLSLLFVPLPAAPGWEGWSWSLGEKLGLNSREDERGWAGRDRRGSLLPRAQPQSSTPASAGGSLRLPRLLALPRSSAVMSFSRPYLKPCV